MKPTNTDAFFVGTCHLYTNALQKPKRKCRCPNTSTMAVRCKAYAYSCVWALLSASKISELYSTGTWYGKLLTLSRSTFLNINQIRVLIKNFDLEPLRALFFIAAMTRLLTLSVATRFHGKWIHVCGTRNHENRLSPKSVRVRVIAAM